jgi:hypothetical protein
MLPSHKTEIDASMIELIIRINSLIKSMMIEEVQILFVREARVGIEMKILILIDV